jgi:hypothetical protein
MSGSRPEVENLRYDVNEPLLSEFCEEKEARDSRQHQMGFRAIVIKRVNRRRMLPQQFGAVGNRAVAETQPNKLWWCAKK